jgi:hypothetical protein
MSFANVVSSSGLPPSQQPRPDPGLLEGGGPSDASLPDSSGKVNVVPTNFKSHPQTTSSVADVPREKGGIVGSGGPANFSTGRNKSRSGAKQEEDESFLEMAKQYFLRPGFAGGLIGLGMF